MRKINEISTAMAKGFAAEMTEKMNNGMLKKGCPIMRGVLTVKSGKETEISEDVKRVSITVKVNYPFNILKPSNRRIEVIVENGELCNVKEIMYVALDAINDIASKIVSYTKGYWCDLDSECYPDFVPTIEKYGIEWFERSITEFYDYLTGLEYVNEAVEEQEVYSAPELDEEIEKIADEVFDELNPDFGKWVDGEEVETGFGDGWIDGEWAWEDDGTKPKAPADPKMKEWMESLGCKFEDDEVESIVENALESAMDDGDEYYDDKICQIGKLYVSYTSPCDDFPNGCVCVVDEDGRMYGNWCNVSDSGFAVEFLVDTLEKYNKAIDEKIEKIEEPTEEEMDMTDEEIELINDIVSCVEADGYYYTRLDNEKKIIDKFIDTDEDLQRFEFIKEGDYYHFIATDIIEDTIFQNIIEEAANGCVPDVSGAWYDYEDYRDYLDWDKIIGDVEGYFTDAELKDDFLYDYYNCADDIYNAIKRHMDKFDDEVEDIKLDWGELDDEVAYFMVADDEFAEYVMTNVEEWLDIEEWLVYDDGLYIKFPVEEVEEAPVQSVEDYIMDISSRPVYVKKENITIEYGSDYIEVGLFGSYFVKLYNDDVHAAAYCSEGLSWGKEDLMFAYDIMDYKSHIWAIVNENRKRLAA